VIHNELLRTAVRTQYTLVRLPLTVLDERVVTRYAPKGSPVRQSFARALGALDATARRLLIDDSPAADEPSGGEPLPAEEQEDVAEVAAELLDQQEEQAFAGELAEDDDLRRVQAELQAKHLVEEAEERAESAQS
jgi:hypothetical protein